MWLTTTVCGGTFPPAVVVMLTITQLTITVANPLPNFVFMMADDMGYGDWSRTGGLADTPELEKMSNAPGAVWFQRGYAGNPICSPTRASVMTGRTPARTCIYAVEQHILCVSGVGGCAQGEYGLANATREKGYISGFYGKWHLGSLSDRGVGSPDCYPIPANGRCIMGYWKKNGGCCYGIDAQLDLSHPLNFGFDEFVATPECAASATTNCGCFFYPTPHNNTPCELGHYHNGGTTGVPYLECMQYYVGNQSTPTTTIEPLTFVSGLNDEDYLIDHFEGLLRQSEQLKKPFLAVIFFHGVHIPYVATPATRAKYAARGMDENEQDYWGTIEQIDGAVGRVRRLLAAAGVADHTWVSITADNGPEVNPAGGQGTGNFANPGRTDGLRGRKRDATEGGTREISIVEFPPLIKRNRVEAQYPTITMDYMATLLDLLDLPHPMGRALDGASLVPFFNGDVTERPVEAGIGIHGSFPYGDTNHVVVNGTSTNPYRCPVTSASARLGDVPSNFTSAGHGSQFSWAEGNHLKLFGCKGYCTGKNCNSTSPGFKNPGWHFFLYNLTSDRAETTDLWEQQRTTAQAMFSRFQEWQASIVHSQGPEELGCNAHWTFSRDDVRNHDYYYGGN
eukprot:m.1428668 g.1428668  ORF g.1428668 m.1428668 type:complete len:622 (+) comp25067_c0_seq3:83-1948(+)